MKKLELSILCGLIFSVLMTFSGVKATEFDRDCAGIRDKILRLHILANSDSVEDQNLKLKVRDRLLAESQEIFSNSDKQESIDLATQNIDRLKSVAEDEIKRNGYNYTADVYIDNRYFDVREYGNITMPSGYYDALVVDIGKAEGQNWWCVMFPPLCIPSCTEPNDVESSDAALSDVLNPNETEIVTDEKYEVKFKLLEIWDDIKSCFS